MLFAGGGCLWKETVTESQVQSNVLFLASCPTQAIHFALFQIFSNLSMSTVFLLEGLSLAFISFKERRTILIL